MTGYGRGDYQDDSFSFTFEIKTVNHRYAELSIRMPRFLAPLENRMRKVILDDVSRGHMDVFVNAAYTGTEGRQITIDKGLAKAYHDGLKELSALLGAHEGAVDEGREVLFVAKCPDVVIPGEAKIDLETLWPHMLGAVQTGLRHLDAMREEEGRNISQDVARRVDLIEEKLSFLEERAPEAVKDYEKRLEERHLEEVRAHGAGHLDESRIIQEVALYADKVNTTEEMVRLHSHIKQFRQMLQEDHPVGRRMDFLVQEFNREANTIASKCSDSTMTQTVVEMKGEIEKVREQIQNIQ